MNAPEPSTQVVEQRVRNRLIEFLEMLVVYETDPPSFGLNEVLNQWEDWNPRAFSHSRLSAPVYTSLEAEKLSLVAIAWSRFCDVTPNNISHEAEELLKPEWRNLVSAGRAALLELQCRGKLSEEFEVLSGNSAA
jgi:hypothetical protein